MISFFPVLIKLNQLNISTQQLTDLAIACFLSSEHRRCSVCQGKHLKRKCSYERGLTDYRSGKVNFCYIRSCRYICECGKSHVLLPSIISPYRRYSFILIISCLRDYYCHTLSVEKICIKYDISIPTLYRWKKDFERNKALYLKTLKDIETSAADFIRQILEDYDFASFMDDSVKDDPCRRFFLQNHKYAYSKRLVQRRIFMS